MPFRSLPQRLNEKLRPVLSRLEGLHDSLFVLLFVALGYLLVARGVDNFYPFSTFSMYAAVEENSASRVLVRDGAGRLREVSSFRGWACDRPVDLNPEECETTGRYYRLRYIDDATARRLATPATDLAAAEPVTLLRRIWWFDDAGGISSEECELASCRAVPK